MTALKMTRVPRWLPMVSAVGLSFLWGLTGCGSPTHATTVPVVSVKLDHATLNLTVGGASATLAATVAPLNATNCAVTWASSNPAVASVSALGVVSPLAAGTATVTVTTKDGGKTDSCAVTVASNVVAVTGLTLDRSTLDLVAGAAPVSLVATITPASATDKSVVWQSSATGVATVSDAGLVTPVGPGTATIVVKTADGSRAATCTVTVTAAPVGVTGVTLDKTTLGLTVGSVAPALVATVAPANASDPAVSWSSDKPEVASVDAHGVVTGKAAGTATVTVSTHDGAHTASCTVTVSVPTNAVTGVTLDVSRLDLVVGSFAGQLTATVAPATADNPAVTWTSSDQTVATVSATGLVSPVASGTATVTVTTVEGAKTHACAVTVHSDPVTSLAAAVPLPRQLKLTWNDPVDLNATGIQVTLQAAGGSVSRVVPVGTKTTVFTGLTPGAPYTVSVRVLGGGGTSSDQVSTSTTLANPVKVLRMNGGTMILTDTFGSSATETHDLVIANSAEINTVNGFPKNYRWVLTPGLTDPADPSLVSFKNEAYTSPDGGAILEWVETPRYLHIQAGGVSDNGQFYNWCMYTPPAITHVAYAEPVDAGDTTFAASATFKMIPSSKVDGGTTFQWLGDSTGHSYLIDDCYHVVAQDSATILQDSTRPKTAFEDNSAWFFEEVTTFTP